MAGLKSEKKKKANPLAGIETATVAMASACFTTKSFTLVCDEQEDLYYRTILKYALEPRNYS